MFVHVYAKNPRWVEVGRIAFFCGLFTFLFEYGPHLLSIFAK